jgi:hypothetical protein
VVVADLANGEALAVGGIDAPRAVELVLLRREGEGPVGRLPGGRHARALRVPLESPDGVALVDELLGGHGAQLEVAPPLGLSLALVEEHEVAQQPPLGLGGVVLGIVGRQPGGQLLGQRGHAHVAPVGLGLLFRLLLQLVEVAWQLPRRLDLHRIQQPVAQDASRDAVLLVVGADRLEHGRVARLEPALVGDDRAAALTHRGLAADEAGVALEALEAVGLLPHLQALADDRVEIHQDVLAQEPVHLVLARGVPQGQRPQLGGLVRRVVVDVHVRVRPPALDHEVHEALEGGLLGVGVVRPRALVRAVGVAPAPEVLDAALGADVGIALEVEEDVAPIGGRQPGVAATEGGREMAVVAGGGVGPRGHLERGLVPQQVEALSPELAGRELGGRGGEAVRRLDADGLEAVALHAPRSRDAAEVVVGLAAGAALGIEVAQRAVGHRLRVARDRARLDEALEPTGDVAVQCGVAVQLHGVLRAVAENQEGRRRLEALDAPEQPGVERELVDDVGPHLAGELRVEHLVAPGDAEHRRGDLHPPQEVEAPLPAPVEQQPLEDQWRALAHGRDRPLGLGDDPLARRVLAGAWSEIHVAAQLARQPRELLALVNLSPGTGEIAV